MTHPPHDPSNPGPSQDPEPAYGYGYAHGYEPGRDYGYDAEATAAAPAAPEQPAAQEPPATTSGRRRGIAIGAAVAGALALGGGGYAVASFLSGGGAQPEEVLPADTIAFVKLDLDPAIGQKTAMASLLEKFPTLGDGAGDIKVDLVDQLLEASDANLSFEQDVEPWLGDRMALAAVPDDGSEAGVAPVLVLAVTDQQAMGDTLREVRDDLGLGFAVRDDFVLVAQSQETADRLAAEESSLAEDGDYTGDLEALDGDQIAVAWADLSQVDQLFATALGDMAMPGLAGEELSGRVIFGLHAEDDALELVGLDFTASDVGPGPRPTEPTRLIQNLPEDTVGAVSLSGVGDFLVQQWEEMTASGVLPPEFEDTFAELEMPEDLRYALGDDLAVAVLGDLEQPQVGVRVVTDEPDWGGQVADYLLWTFTEAEAQSASVDDGYVRAIDQATAQALSEDGGLGDTDAFRAAVPAAEDATMVGYADLAAILEQVPDSGGEGFQPSDLAALEALGMSSTNTDEGTRFVLRITTR